MHPATHGCEDAWQASALPAAGSVPNMQLKLSNCCAFRSMQLEREQLLQAKECQSASSARAMQEGVLGPRSAGSGRK